MYWNIKKYILINVNNIYIYMYGSPHFWIDGLVRQLGALQRHAHAAEAREELQHAQRSETLKRLKGVPQTIGKP